MKQLALMTVFAVLSLPVWSAPAATTNTPAAPADQRPSVMLKVKRAQSTGKSSDSHSYYYSYRSTTSGVVLDAEVRSLSKNPVTLKLEWYFVAKDINGDRQWICGSGNKTLELGPPVTSAKERLESPTLQSSTGYYYSSGGGKIDGYIVLVKWEDKVMKVVASSKTLEDIATSPDRLKKMMTSSPNRGGSGSSSGGSSSGNRSNSQ